jgi:hypothetical protein
MLQVEHFRANIEATEKSIQKTIQVRKYLFKFVWPILNTLFALLVLYFIASLIAFFLFDITFSEIGIEIIGVLMFAVVVYNEKHPSIIEYYEEKLAQVKKAYEDLDKINYLLTNKKEFILYLRDFYGGARSHRTPMSGSGASGLSNPLIWPERYGKDTTESCFSYFRNKFPLISIYNKREKAGYPSSGSYFLYPSNSDWLFVVESLMHSAKYVIFDLEVPTIKAGITAEINLALRVRRKNIFLVCSASYKERLLNKFPELQELILCYFEATDLEYQGLDMPFQYREVNFGQFEKLTN